MEINYDVRSRPRFEYLPVLSKLGFLHFGHVSANFHERESAVWHNAGEKLTNLN